LALRIALAAILAATVTLAHRPALRAQALFLDDQEYLTDNPLVRRPGWPSTRRFFTEVLRPSTVSGYYQPLSMVSLMLDYARGGRPGRLGPFHQTSLLLHAANTVLVFALLCALFSRPIVAALLAGLFGLHPMTAEPVLWVGERKTLLATFFVLLTLLAYVRYARRPDRWAIGVSFAGYLLALLSKPTSLPLPVLLLLLDFWPLGRLGRRAVIEKLPFLAAAAVFAVITALSQRQSRYPAEAIALTILHNLAFYPAKIFVPVRLSSIYPMPPPLTAGHPFVIAGIGVAAALGPTLWICLRRARSVVTGVGFFLAAIAPTLVVAGYSPSIAWDKYAYLPMIGLLLPLAALGRRLAAAGPTRTGGVQVWRPRMGALATMALALGAWVALGTAVYARAGRWADTESLYRHLLSLHPRIPALHNDLATALLEKDRPQEAMKHLRWALEIDPHDAQTRVNLGHALLKTGDAHAAAEQLRTALRLEPASVRGHANLAAALLAMGNPDGAVAHARIALERNAESAQAHAVLAGALLKKDQAEEALAAYERAIALAPEDPEIRTNYGAALESLGRTDAAARQYIRAMELRPGAPPILNNLAWVLATTDAPPEGRPADPLALAKVACRSAGEARPEFLDTLAAAYADACRFPEAVRTAEEAIELASRQGRKELAAEIKRRANLYRAGRPYRSLPGQSVAPPGSAPTTSAGR